MKKLQAIADVYKGDVDPDDWVVWVSNVDGDGGLSLAIFSGSDAEERAVEYAETKFVGFRRRVSAEPSCSE